VTEHDVVHLRQVVAEAEAAIIAPNATYSDLDRV
jgi:hypothetical protein